MRPRTATGRFAPAAKGEAAPLPLSRQERRYQARMAAKVARAWSEVTGGDGVTLVDGEEVKPGK